MLQDCMQFLVLPTLVSHKKGLKIVLGRGDHEKQETQDYAGQLSKNGPMHTLSSYINPTPCRQMAVTQT